MEPEDPNLQREEDLAIIEDYLSEKGFSADQIDTTASGVRYVILDEGMVENDDLRIDESDFVDFDYIGRLTTGSLFDTSIESIAIEDTVIYSESRDYEPFSIVYTTLGWTIQGRFIQGFSDGITATFDGLYVGGRALIVIPSSLGYGSVPQFGNDGVETIPANSVTTFEVIIVAVTEQ